MGGCHIARRRDISIATGRPLRTRGLVRNVGRRRFIVSRFWTRLQAMQTRKIWQIEASNHSDSEPSPRWIMIMINHDGHLGRSAPDFPIPSIPWPYPLLIRMAEIVTALRVRWAIFRAIEEVINQVEQTREDARALRVCCIQ
jgi:hypothetical protein